MSANSENARIIVGLDGSPRQEGVLAAAIEQARCRAAKLLLVRAVSIPAELPTAALKLAPNEVGPILLENAKKDLDWLARAVPKELLSGVQVLLGTPWHTLCDLARENGAPLLVIGSHGYGGLDRLLGTTAARVVNHATCSVLVVR